LVEVSGASLAVVGKFGVGVVEWGVFGVGRIGFMALAQGRAGIVCDGGVCGVAVCAALDAG